MNNWSIPDWLEKEVKERDKVCVYCGVKMTEKMSFKGSRKKVATWEHIINDASIVTLKNIARCCVAYCCVHCLSVGSSYPQQQFPQSPQHLLKQTTREMFNQHFQLIVEIGEKEIQSR